MTVPTSFKAACVQVTSGPDIEANLRPTGDLIRRAREQGADLITTPEVVGAIIHGRKNTLAATPAEADHPAIPFYSALANETGAWVLVGSLAVKLNDSTLANRSYLMDPAGGIAATYDKIHMFDVDLAGGESYRESATYRPGKQAVVADLPWGRLGMTICYDMRFAYLYRALAKAGAQVITVPAAFTVPTGRAHWHVLLRARAIETGCFVVAAAQCGTHDHGRKTYGHSIIISPWGEILAEAGEEPGVIVAELDLAKVEEARRAVPSIHHDRAFDAPQTPYAGIEQAAE